MTHDSGLAQKPGDIIGSYRLLEILGEGGMGVVWLAERREPHIQRVAIKLVKAGSNTKQWAARFALERQLLARMNHPNIAQVLDGGEILPEGAGRPVSYIVLEYVPGERITEYCDKHRLPIRDRLALFMSICDALQHAHSKGIVHRDIKPSNILVTEIDKKPVAKLIDFGVAKAIMDEGLTLHTSLGEAIGTLGYMSPEQAEIGPAGVDALSDVYSLGVLLYEILTGVPPFDTAQLVQKVRSEALKIIADTDPPAPSTRLSRLRAEMETRARSGTGSQASAGRAVAAEGVVPAQSPGTPGSPPAEATPARVQSWTGTRPPADVSKIAHDRRSEVQALIGQLARELEWIPMRAMRREPKERYRSAMEMGDDVKRYLAGEPLLAGPASAWYIARKIVRKHRGRFVAGGLVLAALVVGLLGTLWGLRAARLERAEALAQTKIAQAAQQDAELAAKRTGGAKDSILAMITTALDPRDGKSFNIQEPWAPLDIVSDRLASGGLDLTERDRLAIHRAIAMAYRAWGRAESAAKNFGACVKLDDALGEPEESRVHDASHEAGWLLRTKVPAVVERGKQMLPGLLARARALPQSTERPEVFGHTLGVVATDAYESGKHDDAIVLFEEGIALFSSQESRSRSLALLLNNYAACLRAKQRYPEAEAAVRRAIAMHEASGSDAGLDLNKAYSVLTAVLAETGRPRLAHEASRRAFNAVALKVPENHADSLSARYNLAQCAVRVGAFDAAADSYRILLAHPGAWQSFAPDAENKAKVLFNAAAALREAGDTNASLAAYDRAAEQWPLAFTDPAVLPRYMLMTNIERGITLAQSEDARPARKLFDEKIAANIDVIPKERITHWRAVMLRGLLRVKEGDREEGLKDLHEAHERTIGMTAEESWRRRGLVATLVRAYQLVNDPEKEREWTAKLQEFDRATYN